MKRFEVFANQSVREEIVLAFERLEGARYTIVPTVQGKGREDWKLGTVAWPEENFLLISYMEDEAAAVAGRELDRLKGEFPLEGIRYFLISAQ